LPKVVELESGPDCYTRGMNARSLGVSGLQVSEIAYGNWVTHGSQIGSDHAADCVRAALAAGITTFDTADVYADGRAEEVLGAALKGQPRETIEVCTKVYWGPHDPTNAQYKNAWGLSRKHLRHAIDASLRRLQMDYVDLYQAHRYDPSTPLEETMAAFADIVRAGKALYVGVSEWSADQIRRGAEVAAQFGVPLVSNQPEYSMLWRTIEADVVPASVECGIGQLVWSPMAQGVLSGKYMPGRKPPPGSRAADPNGGADMIRSWLRDEVLARVQALRPVAADLGLSMSQLAIAWVLQNPNVAAALVGGSRPEQIEHNAAAAGTVLTAEVRSLIDEVLGDVVVYEAPPGTSRGTLRARPEPALLH
jgi:aryl-alcohol dehydrogenase-like predicted oxidoreductase